MLLQLFFEIGWIKTPDINESQDLCCFLSEYTIVNNCRLAFKNRNIETWLWRRCGWRPNTHWGVKYFSSFDLDGRWIVYTTVLFTSKFTVPRIFAVVGPLSRTWTHNTYRFFSVCVCVDSLYRISMIITSRLNDGAHSHKRNCTEFSRPSSTDRREQRMLFLYIYIYTDTQFYQFTASSTSFSYRTTG